MTHEKTSGPHASDSTIDAELEMDQSEKIKQSLEEFHEVLLSIPNEEKRAYLQALELCPELIELETPPILFLKYKDFQVWAAVQTFIENWEIRLEFYGDDAFLPINFTGRGALNESDIMCLEQGEFCFLPDDEHGNPTLLIAPRKICTDTEAFFHNCTRVSYALRLICAHRQTPGGYNVIYIPSEVSGQFMQMPNFAKFLKTHDLIPAKQRGLFTLMPPKEEDPSSEVVMGIKYNKQTVWNYLKPLCGQSKEEIFQKLHNGGFRRKGIPTFLGGTWDASQFLTWLEKKREEDLGSSSMTTPEYVLEPTGDEEPSSEMDAKLRDFQRILNSVPEDKKQAYLKAHDRCHDLVEKESHPLLFLRHANFDVPAAVEIFLGFWELRLRLLGEERAFLPLNLTGKGALDEDTCRLIESGAVVILPKDKQGRAEVLFDTRYNSEGDTDTVNNMWLKALFFVRVLLAQRATTEGFAIIYFHNDFSAQLCKAYDMYREQFRMIPQSIKAKWAIVSDENEASSLMVNRSSSSTPIQPLFAVSTQEILEKLESVGYSKAGLPESIGGQWSTAAFISWVKSFRNHDPATSILSPPTYAIDTARATEKNEKLREFYAILSSLAIHEKQAYLFALERCPALIERECPPSLFLKAKNYHVWAAVHDFVGYWEFRYHLFGDRAFSPMNLTGDGALGEHEIRLIESGELAFLPCQDDGGHVLLIALQKSSENIETRVRQMMRAVFFLRLIVAHSVTEFSVIQRHSDECTYVHSTSEGIKSIERFTLLPPFFPKFYPILTVKNEEEREHVHNNVDEHGSVVRYGLDHFVAINTNEIAEHLRRKGFAKEKIPECLGGSWDLSRITTWVRDHKNDDPTSSLLQLPSFALGDLMITEDDDAEEVVEPIPKDFSNSEALARLEEVVRLLPDGEERAAYMEALSCAPDLVKEESDPFWFLRAANFDAWDAAKRLTTYWYYRKRWFGERAHLPMNPSGNGALTIEDVEVLRQGAAQLLPCDKDGRPVVFWRLLPSESEENAPESISRLRISFYLMTLAQRSQKCQELGIILLIFYGEYLGHFRPFNWQDSEGLTNLGIASRMTKGYLLSPYSTTTGPDQLQLVKEMLTNDITIVSLSDDPGENIQRMIALGLLQSGIPEDLGGTWNRQCFDDWLEEQHTIQTAARSVQEKPREDENQATSFHSSGLSSPSGNEQYILLARLETALSDIGLGDKIDLLTARERAPALVAAESPPARFLRCENFDFAKAATRWCAYWKGRKSLFGPRALLPIHSYEAMLSDREISYVKGMLKRSVGVDTDGRSIIAFSGRRPADSGLDSVSLARCYFVVFHHFIKNDASQSHGIVLFREWIPSKFLPSSYKSMDEIVTTMMPIRIFAHHLLCVLPETGKLTFYQSISTRLFGISSVALAQKTNVHMANSRSGLKELMISIGMQLPTLPEIFFTEVFDSTNDLEMDDVSKLDSIDDDSEMSHESPTEGNGEFDLNSIKTYMAKLEASENAAFFEVLKTAPDLIMKESSPRRFLVLERNRRTRAVQRLARYWTERKKLFGNRAFLPLDQTGEGALSKEDIAVLNSGFLSVLRNDEQNIPVGIFDGSRAVPQQLQIALRIMFYVGTVLCEYDATDSMKCRFVIVASVLSLDCGLDKIFGIIDSWLPITIHDMFIVPAPSERGKSSFYDSVAPQIIRLLGPALGSKTVVIKGDSPAKRGKEMEKYGFALKALPVVAGGEWNFAQFFQWQETRIRIEWSLPLSTVQKASVPKGKSYNVPNLSELPEPEQVERKRRLNLLHSRRKREKERAQIEALQEQVADLEDTNRKVDEENTRLEEAIRQASQYMSGSSPPSLPRPARSGVEPAARLTARDDANADDDDDDSGDNMMLPETAGFAAPSSGNKRILEEYLLQQPRVSVPSSVWLHMMNNNNQQSQQDRQNEALWQFLSGMPGNQRQIPNLGNNPQGLPYGSFYPPPFGDDDRKRRRF